MPTVKLTLHPPRWSDRVWARRHHTTPPIATSGGRGNFARLVPYRWRWFHRWYADLMLFFWIPCPLCDRPFGGHEVAGDVPDPTRQPGGLICVCSPCARSRNQAAT
jgi:hypothetical protein